MKSLKFLLLSLVFSFSSSLFVQPAQAQDVCERIFGGQSQIASSIRFGQLNPNFKHNARFSKELPEDLEIKNQCQLGTCHLHAWVSSLERSFKRRTGRSISIDTRYVSFVHWKETVMKTLFKKKSEILEQLAKNEKPLNPMLGETPLGSRDAIRKYGLVPAGVWKPKMDFEKDPVADRIEEFVSNRIGRLKWELDQQTDPRMQLEMTEQAELDLNHIIDQFGQTTEEFSYRGKSFNPESFAREHFPELYAPSVLALVDDKANSTTYSKNVNGDGIAYMNVYAMEDLAKRIIDSGHSVYLGYQHEAAFVDKKSGVMSISAFIVPEFAKPLTREQRRFYKKHEGGHAVEIVGYDLDPQTGKVLKWKIQNSWGADSGDRGIYHMYSDYFRTYANAITFGSDVKVTIY